MIDENNELILIKDEDQTSKIEYYEKTPDGFNIRFTSSDTIYPYKNKTKITILKNPKVIDPNTCCIYSSKGPLFDILKILDFKSHIKIFLNIGTRTYCKKDLKIEKNILSDDTSKTTLLYLEELAQSISNEENDFLNKQYERMKFISERSVLAKYLKHDAIKKSNYSKVNIFPFGLNLSQEAAVSQALAHQVSIIEGPPGTGKTQTILNIIANLILNNKTIAVASNNNTAIQNVYDKLESYNLSFFAAVLGKSEQKKKFFQNQQPTYPTIDGLPSQKTLRATLEENIVHIKKMLQVYNDLAKTKQDIEALALEKRYFLEMYKHRGIEMPNEALFLKFDLPKALSLLAEFESLEIQERSFSFFIKLKIFFKYKIFSLKFYMQPLASITLFLKKVFYEIKEKDLTLKAESLEGLFENSNLETMLEQYKNESMSLLKLHLSKKYKLDKKRPQFTEDILWKDFTAFSKEYPVVLSTTHSLRNCTGEKFLYDYLIIDEASQVDIVAGSLALSCAKNVIIVGDLKQLPHIITKDTQEAIDSVFKRYALGEHYHYRYSLLESASIVFEGVPKTLLKEHYRCHSKIIDFCNKKFYNNELIILSKDQNKDPLVWINTVEGQHARGQYNRRQIEVIQDEILPHLNTKSLGIISPFRQQVKKLNDVIKLDSGMEIDTVHKYQGREKDVIIISTVVDEENQFADNPNLLNVAVSRAKNQLFIIASDCESNKNMKDLIDYIKYNNLAVTESKIWSIFDLLYANYAPYLKKYLADLKNMSSHQSENLMGVIIDEVLHEHQYFHIAYVMHYPLRQLIQDKQKFFAEELAFSKAQSHIDFLLYNKICNRPILAIEVDGVTYHENSQKQLKRDALKDSILAKCNISLLRFATNGSGEKEKLSKKLQEVL